MDSEIKFAHEIVDGLNELKKLQDIRNTAHKLKGERVLSNPLAFAKETVNHFYGLETGNLLIDLYYEQKHLKHFYRHLVDNSRGDNFKELEEIRIASKAYEEAIARYSAMKDDEAFREYMKEVEGII